MTRNLKIYAVFCTIWSVLFFVILNWCLQDQAGRWQIIAVTATVYGLGFGAVGYVLGRPDDQSKVRYNLGDAYSATSNIASAAIGSVWIAFFRPREAWTLAVYLPIIGLVALLGLYKYKKSIKGMNNKELFK